MVALPVSGYSSNVRIELFAGTERFLPAQVGAGKITFDRDVVLPGTEGELILYIDEHPRRWHLTWEVSDLPRKTWMAEYRDVAYTPTETGAMEK